jgi:hypothetical protein
VTRFPTRALAAALALVAAGCGRGEEVDTASYTCGEFNRSLKEKDDLTSGQFIRKLNEQAKLGGTKAEQERRMAYAVYVACRGKASGFKPTERALANAKALKAGKQVVPDDVRERAEKAAKKAADAEE